MWTGIEVNHHNEGMLQVCWSEVECERLAMERLPEYERGGRNVVLVTQTL